VAGLTFVLVNPLLYPDPVGRTTMLLEHRREEMGRQMLGRLGVPDDLRIRTVLVYRRTFEDYSPFYRRLSWPIDTIWVAGGLVVALAATWRHLRRRALLGPPTLLLCWALAAYAMTIVNFDYDSAHYLAPLVMANVLLESVALGCFASWVGALLVNGMMGRRGSHFPATRAILHPASREAVAYQLPSRPHQRDADDGSDESQGERKAG